MLPDSLESLGDYAFSGVNGLTTPIRVPETVDIVGSEAFNGVNLPVEVYPWSGGLDYAVNNNIDHTVLEYDILLLPAALTSIESEAFANTAANAVMLPDGASVAPRAFADGAIRVIVLPDQIGNIADDAFVGCPIRHVICKDNTPAQEWAKTQGYATRAQGR